MCSHGPYKCQNVFVVSIKSRQNPLCFVFGIPAVDDNGHVCAGNGSLCVQMGTSTACTGIDVQQGANVHVMQRERKQCVFECLIAAELEGKLRALYPLTNCCDCARVCVRKIDGVCELDDVVCKRVHWLTYKCI